MNEIILGADNLKVQVTLGVLQDITNDVRKQVDYVCCVDLEGNQSWHTTTDQDAIEKMIQKGHSESLGKVGEGIQTFLKLASLKQVGDGGIIKDIQGPRNSGKVSIPSFQEVQFLAGLNERHDRERTNRQREAAVQSACGSICRQNGIRAELGQF